MEPINVILYLFGQLEEPVKIFGTLHVGKTAEEALNRDANRNREVLEVAKINLFGVKTEKANLNDL